MVSDYPGHTPAEEEDLAVLMGSWTAAGRPVVHARRFVWPELGNLADQYRSVNQQADDIDAVLSLARIAYKAVRTLSCSPAPPVAGEAGLEDLVRRCSDFIDNHRGHSLAPKIDQLLQAACDVLTSSSPLLASVEAELGNFGKNQHPPWIEQPEAALVVPPDLVEVSKAFLKDAELTADVCTPEQVKQRHYRGLILCGDLVTAYYSPWRPKHTYSTYGWLVTAPPADKVIILENQLGSNDFDKLWLLGSEAHPHLSVTTSLSSPEKRDILRLPPPPHLIRPTIFDPSFPREHSRPASQVLLGSGRMIFFSDHEGPRPRIVVVEETEVEIKEHVKVENLAAGGLLLIRATGSAYDEIRRRAEMDLMDNSGWASGDIEHAHELVASIKRHLQETLHRNGEEALVADLVRRGLNRAYAKHLCRMPLAEHYIAPKAEGFAPLVQAIGVPQLVSEESYLRSLRTAHRRAGSAITSELSQLLSNDLTWLDRLALKSFVVVDGGTLGGLLVETIACPAETGYRVPVTYLGHVLTGDPLHVVEMNELRRPL